MAKKKSTKNWQGTDKLYSSNWIYCDKLAFLVPVTGASKSRETLKGINSKEDGNEKELGGTLIPKRKTLLETKLDLLPQCTEAITSNTKTKTPLTNESATTKMSVFSLHA